MIAAGYPSGDQLAAGLTSALSQLAHAGDITVVGREGNPYESTSPSEVVTCRLPDGDSLRVLCKYGTRAESRRDDHRSGVPYEVAVYRHVLAPIGMSTPRFYGSYHDPVDGRLWLVVEYADDGERLSRSSGAYPGVVAAARWIGRFHALNESRLADPALAFLNVYDRRYFAGWIERAAACTSAVQREYPWLGQIWDRADQALDRLASLPRTVVHGEFYPANVMLRGLGVCPIDWESAAVAGGELDLVTLVEGWPPHLVAESEHAYAAARWADGAPADYRERLDGSRMYWSIRWLGDRPEWAGSRLLRPRFETLGAAARRLGLLT